MTELTPDNNGLRQRPDNELYDKGSMRLFQPHEFDTTSGWDTVTFPNGQKADVFFLTVRDGGMTYTIPFATADQVMAWLSVVAQNVKNPRRPSGLFVPPKN